jgi:hypothetical protein
VATKLATVAEQNVWELAVGNAMAAANVTATDFLELLSQPTPFVVSVWVA